LQPDCHRRTPITCSPGGLLAGRADSPHVPAGRRDAAPNSRLRGRDRRA
jgi:hypothetical protein